MHIGRNIAVVTYIICVTIKCGLYSLKTTIYMMHNIVLLILNKHLFYNNHELIPVCKKSFLNENMFANRLIK